MAQLSTCNKCSGFVRSESTKCPHCEAPKAAGSSWGLRALGLLGTVGGSAIAVTMMACYGCPDAQACGYPNPTDLGCTKTDGGSADGGAADGGCR